MPSPVDERGALQLAARKSTGAPPAAARKRTTKVKSNPIRDVALAIAQAALDRKALSVEIIDVTGKVDYADYVVVMSATSDRHANAIAKNVDTELSRKGMRPHSVEGLPQGAWVLMDFGDVVVHVFDPEDREFYNLERFWQQEKPAAVA